MKASGLCSALKALTPLLDKTKLLTGTLNSESSNLNQVIHSQHNKRTFNFKMSIIAARNVQTWTVDSCFYLAQYRSYSFSFNCLHRNNLLRLMILDFIS